MTKDKIGMDICLVMLSITHCYPDSRKLNGSITSINLDPAKLLDQKLELTWRNRLKYLGPRSRTCLASDASDIGTAYRQTHNHRSAVALPVASICLPIMHWSAQVDSGVCEVQCNMPLCGRYAGEVNRFYGFCCIRRSYG